MCHCGLCQLGAPARGAAGQGVHRRRREEHWPARVNCDDANHVRVAFGISPFLAVFYFLHGCVRRSFSSVRSAAAGASISTGRGIIEGGVSATATAQAQKAPCLVSMSVVCLARCPRASAEAFARGARGVFSLRILAEAGCSSQRANRRAASPSITFCASLGPLCEGIHRLLKR